MQSHTGKRTPNSSVKSFFLLAIELRSRSASSEFNDGDVMPRPSDDSREPKSPAAVIFFRCSLQRLVLFLTHGNIT